MGWYIGLHHVCPKGYSTHYYLVFPFQQIFGHNSIINQHHHIEWERIRKQKQDFVNKGIKHENCIQINHTYKKEDRVLLKNAWNTKFNQDAYIGPYIITAVRNNSYCESP